MRKLGGVLTLCALLATPALAQFPFHPLFPAPTRAQRQARYDAIKQYDIELLKNVDRSPKDVFVYAYVDQSLKDFPVDRVMDEVTCYFAKYNINLHRLNRMPKELDKEIIAIGFNEGFAIPMPTGKVFFPPYYGVAFVENRVADVRDFDGDAFALICNTTEHEICHLLSLPHTDDLPEGVVVGGEKNLMYSTGQGSDLTQLQLDQMYSYLSGGQMYRDLEEGYSTYVYKAREAIELRRSLEENLNARSILLLHDAKRR